MTTAVLADILDPLTSTGFVRKKLYVLKGKETKMSDVSLSAANQSEPILASAQATLREGTTATSYTAVDTVVTSKGSVTISTVLDQSSQARLKGYEGDSCQECGNFTLVRNGTCLKCDTCGSTSGCS